MAVKLTPGEDKRHKWQSVIERKSWETIATIFGRHGSGEKVSIVSRRQIAFLPGTLCETR